MQRRFGQCGQQRSPPRRQLGRSPLRSGTEADLLELPRQLDDEAGIAPVGHQQIGAVAQEKGLHPQLRRRFQDGLDLFHGPGQGHQRRRAADAEGGVLRHGLVHPQLHFRTALPQQFFQSFHRPSIIKIVVSFDYSRFLKKLE